jgi:histidyl-tRNA synthetase
VGSNEMANARFSIKKMSSGEKNELSLTELVTYLNNELHEIHH